GFRRSEDRRAAHAAGAVVDVPVGVDLAELLARLLGAAEVVLHVGEGAEETFFLAAPECDADRAARLGAGGLEDARGLHHDRAADRVVGGAGRAGPRVEVAAHHHDFVGLVSAGNLADGYVRGFSFGEVLVGDVELDRDRLAVLRDDAVDAPVIVRAEDDRGKLRRGIIVDLAGAVLGDNHAGNSPGALRGEAEGGRIVAEEGINTLGDLLIG